MTTQRTHRNWQLGNMVFLILALAAPAMAQQPGRDGASEKDPKAAGRPDQRAVTK